ncbi:MAG: acetylornithine transaminase, partial [Verrucomicrobiales bacterium]|nr:acetylornithine transaminase [Verrucomicrobiales bacterium]
MNTEEKTSEYIVPNYGRFTIAPVRGQGVWLWDEDGKRYLDFACGIAVCSLGHCHPALVEALKRQGEKLWHCSNLYQIGAQAELAEMLVEKVVGIEGKCFFCNSGAEANETLVKLARKYGHATAAEHGGRARYEVITFDGSFHGRTMCGISATGQEKVKVGFAPLLEGFRHVPWNDAGALRAAVNENTVAILVEPVQGEGGINVVSEELLQAAVELREEKGVLLMFDEVQSGLGRTGDLCSWRSVAAGVEPDAISWAKGLGGGFPIGGIWAGARESGDGKLCDLLQPGSHGTTYGGTPLASAVALAVVGTIVDADLAANASGVGRYIVERAESW